MYTWILLDSLILDLYPWIFLLRGSLIIETFNVPLKVSVGPKLSLGQTGCEPSTYDGRARKSAASVRREKRCPFSTVPSAGAVSHNDMPIWPKLVIMTSSNYCYRSAFLDAALFMSLRNFSMNNASFRKTEFNYTFCHRKFFNWVTYPNWVLIW